MFRVFIRDDDVINTFRKGKEEVRDGQREKSSCDIVQTVSADLTGILRLKFLVRDVLLWAKISGFLYCL